MDLIILPFFQTSFLKSYSGRTSGMGIGEQSADLYSAVIHYEKRGGSSSNKRYFNRRYAISYRQPFSERNTAWKERKTFAKLRMNGQTYQC